MNDHKDHKPVSSFGHSSIHNDNVHKDESQVKDKDVKEDKVEDKVEKKDLKVYNCGQCKGEGLVGEILCTKCQGTGKV